MSVFWLEDDWHNCQAELAYCEVGRIDVVQATTLREAYSLLQDASMVGRIRRFVFDVNLQIFDNADLAMFDQPPRPERDLIGPAFFEFLSRSLKDTFESIIKPRSIFYTKMLAPERIGMAEAFSRLHQIELVRKYPGLHARQFVQTLRLDS